MRTLAIALGCVLGLQPTAWALCRSDQKLAIVGTLATDSAVMASAAKEVRLIGVTAAGVRVWRGFMMPRPWRPRRMPRRVLRLAYQRMRRRSSRHLDFQINQ